MRIAAASAFLVIHDAIPVFTGLKLREELSRYMKRLDAYDYAPQTAFKEQYLTYCDGNSGKRVCAYIESNMKE